MVLKKLKNKLTKKKGNKKGDAGPPTSTSAAPTAKDGNNAPSNSMPKTVSEWATSYGSPAEPTSNKSNNADNPDFDKEVDDALAGLLQKKNKPAIKPPQSGPPNDNNNTTSLKPKMEKSNPQSPSLEQQRRTELQALIKDKSLSKEERKTRMEEVKTNYATLADDQRRKELQALMKDKSITKEERKVKMEEVKAKYAVFSVKEQQGSTSSGSGGGGGSKPPQQEAVPTLQSDEPKQHHHIDTQHNSYSASYAEDVHGLQGRTVSIAERKNIFENQEAIVAGKVQQYDATPQHKQKRLQGKFVRVCRCVDNRLESFLSV